MLALILGVFLAFYAVDRVAEVKEAPPGTVYVTNQIDSRVNSRSSFVDRPVVVKPVAETQFRGIVHQAFDYSCGSAALTTVLDGYLGRDFEERQVMEGLLRFGESDKIVARRGFSLLDMKRLATALGYKSGGYKGTLDDLKALEHPAIVPIHYSGFKHFVVVKKYLEGRLFIADPALGNISFPVERFKDVWDGNVMFLIFPNGKVQENKLELAEQDMRYVDDETVNWLSIQDAYRTMNPVHMQEQAADKAAALQLVTDADKKSTTAGQNILVETRTFLRTR